MTEFVKKITVKGAIEKFPSITELVEKKSIPLVDVYGVTMSYGTGETQYGSYIYFNGNFEAMDLASGAVQRSGKLILAGPAESMLAGMLGGNDVTNVQFGFRIGVKLDESAATKYVFTAEPLVEEAETDPLALLRAQIEQARLPAPEPKTDEKKPTRARPAK